MRLSVFSPECSEQLLIDLKKLYQSYLTAEELTSQALQQFIETPNKLFFVTLFNARHLGAVQVTIEQAEAQLHRLCVRDITRRRGVGKNLLREVEKQLKEQGVSRVTLSLDEITSEEQPAMTWFMQHCGYQANGKQLSKQL